MAPDLRRNGIGKVPGIDLSIANVIQTHEEAVVAVQAVVKPSDMRVQLYWSRSVKAEAAGVQLIPDSRIVRWVFCGRSSERGESGGIDASCMIYLLILSEAQ